MRVACDLCEQIYEDSLLQILEKDNQILYVCPECYVGMKEQSPDEQA